MCRLSLPRNYRIVQAVQLILQPCRSVTSRNVRQFRVSDLALETLVSTLIADTQLAYVSELVADIDSTSAKVFAICGEQLIIVVEIHGVAIRQRSWRDKPVSLWREWMVILGPEAVIRKQNNVIAPLRAEAPNVKPGNSRSQVERDIFQTRTIA